MCVGGDGAGESEVRELAGLGEDDGEVSQTVAELHRLPWILGHQIIMQTSVRKSTCNVGDRLWRHDAHAGRVELGSCDRRPVPRHCECSSPSGDRSSMARGHKGCTPRYDGVEAKRLTHKRG